MKIKFDLVSKVHIVNKESKYKEPEKLEYVNATVPDTYNHIMNITVATRLKETCLMYH